MNPKLSTINHETRNLNPERTTRYASIDKVADSVRRKLRNYKVPHRPLAADRFYIVYRQVF